MTEKKKRSACILAKNCKIIIDSDMIDKVKDSGAKLIIGFLGSGLVGNIIASEMVDQLKMEEIGYVVSEDLPAMAIFYDGVLKRPFRLYYDVKSNIVLAQCEVPFNKSETYSDLARLIVDWALQMGIEEIGCIQGLSVNGFPEESPVYVAANEKLLKKIISSTEIQILPRGIVLGPEAALLNECLNNGLNCYTLLTPTSTQFPSPAGAAAIIDQLNKLYSLELKTDKLIEDSQKIREKLLELNKHTQQQHAQLDLQPVGDNSRMYL